MIKLELPKDLSRALSDALAIQLVTGLIAVVIRDGGRCLQLWIFSMPAYWIGCGVITLRRWRTLTKVDIAMIRWGFLIVSLVLSPIITGFIWHLRGIHLK